LPGISLRFTQGQQILPTFPSIPFAVVYSSTDDFRSTAQSPASVHPTVLVLDNEIVSVNLTDLAYYAGFVAFNRHVLPRESRAGSFRYMEQLTEGHPPHL
jgi:hypothetical protein